MKAAHGTRTKSADADAPLALLGLDERTPTSPRAWRRFFVENGLALVLSLQALMAVLIGLRALPVSTAPQGYAGGRLATVVVVSFVLLTLLAVVSLRQHRKSNQRSYRDLLHLAYHDTCTGLPNRAASEHILRAWLAKHDAVSCMFLEVDGIGSDSASLPEATLTALTLSVVARLQPLIGPGDVLGHFTTDRFVLLLHGNHSHATLTSLADTILAVMAPPHTLAGRPLSTSVNIGIALAPVDATNWSALLSAAKSAMSAAREEERDSYRFAQDLQPGRILRSNALSGKLQRALLDGLLHLVYQPIYDQAGNMVAVEALARWHDAEEGNIPPGDFVPVAEATGLIVPLSNWVLRTACSQMAEWVSLDLALQRIAVNVSVKQVSRKDFIPTIRRTLNEVGLPAHRLELEVTEGALASDFESVNRNLQELRQLGVRISIDDFGTGYSSLGRVRELHADVLKIDRVFTQGAGESQSGAAMVAAIINMAHTLQLSVIAEGIETKEQMALLNEMKCDEMQGFYLSRPQQADVITACLETSKSESSSSSNDEQTRQTIARVA
ncbi:MAG: putative bifunctional diguanylate cyclase/phosphodiesterase [Janthinobacterium lividum]